MKPLPEAIKELTSAFSNTVTRLQSFEAPPTPPIAPVVPKYRPLLCPETRRGCPFARTVRYLSDPAWSGRRAFSVSRGLGHLVVDRPSHWIHALPPYREVGLLGQLAKFVHCEYKNEDISLIIENFCKWHVFLAG